MRITQLQKKKSSSLKGFTLVEVMVTVLIFAVLGGAISAVLMVGESSWQANSVRVELTQELRKARGVMEDELRQTSPKPDIITDGPENADGTTYPSITFYLPNGVSGNAITWNANTTQYILGGTDSTDLQRIEGAETRVIARNIQTLGFTRQNGAGDIIEVTLTAEKDTIKGRTLTVNFAFKVQMRN